MNGPQSRALGASAALIVLVALPSVVAGATQEQAAKPAEGALVVQLTGDHGVTTPYILRTQGPGNPPSRAATLHDAGGTVAATVTPVASPCEKATARNAFSDGSVPWCLRVAGVENGAEVSGVLQSADGARLSLTVRSRAAFVFWPCAVLVIGLLAGVVVLVFQPWLRPRVREIVLRWMVGVNARDRDPRTRIEGLDAWIRRQTAEGATADSLIEAVTRVTHGAIARAASAREGLSKRLASARNLSDYALVEAGRSVAAAPNRMEDFYASNLTDREEHPADTFAGAIVQLAMLAKALDDLEAALADVRQPAGLIKRLSLAREDLKAVGSPEGLTMFPARIETLRDAVHDALGEAADRPIGPTRASQGRPLPSLLAGFTLPGPAEVIALVFGPAPRDRLRTARALAWTVAAVLVTWIYAFVSIKHAAYDPKPLFDGLGDYLELFSAALGSGAAATVLGLLNDWRPSAALGKAS